jgi:hypothetical protein
MAVMALLATRNEDMATGRGDVWAVYWRAAWCEAAQSWAGVVRGGMTYSGTNPVVARGSEE